MCKIIRKNKKGFTLGETLVATLIMLMVSSIMVAGIPAAKTAYEKTILKANAEILMSTAVNSLRDEMSVARGVASSTDGDTTEITYINGTYGSASTLYVKDKDDIMYQRYSGGASFTEGITMDEGAVSDKTKLISDSASDKDNKLFVACDGATVDEDKGTITFSGLKVYKRIQGSEPKLILSGKDLSITTF